MTITAVRYLARKTPSGFVGRVLLIDDEGRIHTRELYDFRHTEAEALNDASNLAWFFASKSHGDLSPTRDAR